MAASDLEEKINAEALARAKDMVKRIARDWDWFKWDELLADDVTLSVKLGSTGLTTVGAASAVGGDLEVTGRDLARRVLRGIYDELKKHACITTEVVSGYEFALLGNLAVPDDDGGGGVKSFPIAVHMIFNPQGRIEALTIASVELHPLTAVRGPVENGAPPAA